MSSPVKPHIVCIDDDQNILDALMRDLRHLFNVSTTTDVEQIPQVMTAQTAILICDYNLNGIKGLDVLEKVKKLYPRTMRVLITGEVGLEEIGRSIEAKLVHKFILKPWEPDLLRLQMVEAMGIYNLLNERDMFKELSVTDPVTDLTNHRFFQEKIRIELQKAKTTKTALSLVMIDVDHFKLLNDQFGHPKGDQMLALIARTLSAHLKPQFSLSRYGGEEFALVLPQTASMGAFALAETLRKSVLNLPNLQLRLSISLGVATYPEHGLDADELLSAADQALYCAKRQGRNMTIVGSEIT